eukprot:TRINITY_DN68455_c0_g1_i1.p1 TRINITY_DN68455_c0_g1~~TRINITY_DN68455_c0_g1_i1.p1  ORF type:complete len:299 (+),score=37.58 TRINITY_DN68455_c0_g1_i1:69-899(+)
MMALPSPRVAAGSSKRPHPAAAGRGASAPTKKGRFEGPVSTFECPICCEYMLGHIFQCKEGHQICGECLRKTKATSKVCPSCRKPYPAQAIRNRALEQLAEGCFFECRWGCGASLKPKDMMMHVGKCKLRKVKCPVERCNHMDTLKEMPRHLCSNSHVQDVVRHDASSVRIKTSLDQDLVPKKVHMVSDTCLMQYGVKGSMLSINFCSFHKTKMYAMSLKGPNGQECIFKGRTRPFDKKAEGATVYIPKVLGTTFLTKGRLGSSSRLPFEVCFTDV